MKIVHLLASPFLGGPERQMLGLASHLPPAYETTFVAFPHRGQGQALLDKARTLGFPTLQLGADAPHYRTALLELKTVLRRLRADVVLCHGYKPDLLGLMAARPLGIPCVSVSHGWTASTFKVRIYEAADRLALHAMSAVVCVSEKQACRVRRHGVPGRRIVVIRNAVDTVPFVAPDVAYRDKLLSLFPCRPSRVICSAGRLSPEKGFLQLVEVARSVRRAVPDVGFVHFGDGPLRHELAQRIASSGLSNWFALAGFRTDLECFLPFADLFVLPSFTEGLPVVVLEAFAAGLTGVATAVGGTPEIIDDGVTGFLVPPGRPEAIGRRIIDLLQDDSRRHAMGRRGRQRVERDFTFTAQSQRYQRLFQRLAQRPSLTKRDPRPAAPALSCQYSVS
jgi:glycosyltransferase involved in cell wall biosynthesis